MCESRAVRATVSTPKSRLDKSTVLSAGWEGEDDRCKPGDLLWWIDEKLSPVKAGVKSFVATVRSSDRVLFAVSYRGSAVKCGKGNTVRTVCLCVNNDV